MAGVIICPEPDEVIGLSALADLDGAATGREPDVADLAKTLLHDALAARLEEAGLPWAPPPEAVRTRVAEVTRPRGRLLALVTHRRTRKYAAAVLAVAVLIVLWGGYVQ